MTTRIFGPVTKNLMERNGLAELWRLLNLSDTLRVQSETGAPMAARLGSLRRDTDATKPGGNVDDGGVGL